MISDLQRKQELQDGVKKFREENESLKSQVRTLNTSLLKMRQLEEQMQNLNVDFMEFATTLDASQIVHINSYKEQIARLEKNILSQKTKVVTADNKLKKPLDLDKKTMRVETKDEVSLASVSTAHPSIPKGKNFVLGGVGKAKPQKEKKSVCFVNVVENDRKIISVT